jgi:hypothetical protein
VRSPLNLSIRAGTIIGQTGRAGHDGSIAAAHVQFGDEVAVATWAAGQAMPLKQFLAEVVAVRSCYGVMRCPWIGD